MTTASDPVGLDRPDFPIVFADPAHVELTWEWDEMYSPHAFAPLAGDFAAALAGAFGAPYRKYSREFGPFPQEWFSAVWNGYVYYAVKRNVPDEQRKELSDRIVAMGRTRIPLTSTYWQDELMPELDDLYALTEAVPVETAPLAMVADGWLASWDARQRAWEIHFDILLGPEQVMDDLLEAYEAATPGAGPGEAARLTVGGRHELFDVEVGTESLAAMTTAEPALAAAIVSGDLTFEELRNLSGSEAFVAALEAFLSRHGHLGQSVDDLSLPTWAEKPANFLIELAKRIERTPEAAESRRARLEREAADLADGVRQRLADRPDDLVRFESILRAAREIGFISETHNYWIDRKSQARIRELAVRIGQRLAADGLVDRADDVFFLHNDEIVELLRQPTNQHALIARRRADLERYRRLTPPRFVGRPPPSTIARTPSHGHRVEPTEADVMRGTGSSAGIYRGPARVVLDSTEFGRIRPGDVIVCPSSNPSWVPVFAIAGGLVTNTGGVLSHAAVVAREFALPAVTGVRDATTTINDGRLVEIDGTAGTVRLL